MRKIVIFAGSIGFLVAILAGSIWYYVFLHGLAGTVNAQLFAAVVRCIWPTSIMMFDAEKADPGTALLLCLSAALNSAIYAAAASLCFAIWEKLARKSGKSTGSV